MRPFWPIVCVALFATLCVWPNIVHNLTVGDISYHATRQQWQLVCYPITIALLSVVWAILCRPQLERGRVSLTAVFGLVTLLAIGLCFAKYMLSLRG